MSVNATWNVISALLQFGKTLLESVSQRHAGTRRHSTNGESLDKEGAEQGLSIRRRCGNQGQNWNLFLCRD